MKNNPIVCNLTESELRGKREEISGIIKSHVREIRDLDSGLAFRFDANDVIFDILSGFIQNERKCCTHFRFKIIVEPNAGPVWLEITGDRAKDFLRAELGL